LSRRARGLRSWLGGAWCAPGRLQQVVRAVSGALNRASAAQLPHVSTTRKPPGRDSPRFGVWRPRHSAVGCGSAPTPPRSPC